MQDLDATLTQTLALDAILSATTEETVSPVISMVRGDTRPTLRFTIRDENGTPIVITGSTPRFRIFDPLTESVKVNRVCTVTDGPGGVCTFAWDAADWGAGVLDTLLRYLGELEVTFSDATVGTVWPLYEIHVRKAAG